jgi:hypothetical protein
MCSRHISLIAFPLLLIIMIPLGCGSTPPQANLTSKGNPLFLQNNIHAQSGGRDTKASYANWTDPGSGHIIIPVNTPVEIGRFRRGFSIKNLNSGKFIYFEYNSTNMGMSAEQYIDLITSLKKVNLDQLSEIDQKGIKSGEAFIGMSKAGVRIALGYPATHRTPSLEDNSWVYWRDRWKTKVIEFDTAGKVSNIRD